MLFGQSCPKSMHLSWEFMLFFNSESDIAFLESVTRNNHFSQCRKTHWKTLWIPWSNGWFLGQKSILTSIWDRKTNGFWTAILTFGKVAFCLCFIMVISLLPECKIVTQNRYVLNGLRSIFRLGAPFGGSQTICFPMVFEQQFWLLAKLHFAYVL